MTLDYNAIVAELNAGRIVFLYKDGKTIAISRISEIPGDLSGSGYVRTFGQYPVQGTPTNGQTLIFNTDHFEYGTVSAGASSWSALTGKPADLVTIAGLTPVNDDFLQRKAGGWVNRTVAQVKTDLGAIAVGDSPTVTGQWTYAAGSITTSKPLSVTQTWNAVGTTFNSLLVNVTDTASAAGSLLADFQVAGVSKFRVRKDGRIYTPLIGNDPTFGTSPAAIFFSGANMVWYISNGTIGTVSSTGLTMGSGTAMGWNDVSSTRHAAGVARLTNGSTGAGRILLGTSSDTSSAQLDVRSQTVGLPALQVQAASGESANATILNVRNGAGGQVAAIHNTGVMIFPTSNSTAPSASGVGNWFGTLALFGNGGALAATVANNGINLSSSVIFNFSGDVGFVRAAAANLRVTNGSTGAGKLLLGTSSDTSAAQLDVRSQATGTPAAQFQAASGESGSATVLSVKDGAGADALAVRADGAVVAPTNFSIRSSGMASLVATGATIRLRDNSIFSWASGSDPTGVSDTILRRAAAANLAQGAADINGTPDVQRFSVQNAITGSNLAGSTRHFDGSVGTGSGNGGDIVFNTAPAGSAGTSQNALVAQLTVKGSGGGIVVSDAGIALGRTITASGTTGAQTINKSAGTVNAAAAATSIVVTNSLVTANSLVFCQIRTDDATAVIKSVVPAAGSFTINLTAPTAETSIGFMVVN